MTYRNRALLDLAEGKPCMNCGREDGTVVAAHSNRSEHGRGKDHKSHDCFSAWLCWRCHSWYDHGGIGKDPTGIYQAARGDKDEMFSRAMERTWRSMWERGLISLVGKHQRVVEHG